MQQIGSPITKDPFAEANFLLRGTPSKWERIDAIKEQEIHTSRAAVFGDIDNDGGVDVLVINRDAPAYLLMNIHPNRANSVVFSVKTKDGRDALGAVVSAKVNGATITHPVQSTWSYMAANDPRVRFGLGKNKEVSEVTVTWVDGTKTLFGTFTHGEHTLKNK